MVFNNSIYNRINKVNVKLNKPLYLGLSNLSISKMTMYEYWYDYAKPKYGDKAKLWYTDRDSFLVYIKSKNVYTDFAGDSEKRFDTSEFDAERP